MVLEPFELLVGYQVCLDAAPIVFPVVWTIKEWNKASWIASLGILFECIWGHNVSVGCSYRRICLGIQDVVVKAVWSIAGGPATSKQTESPDRVARPISNPEHCSHDHVTPIGGSKVSCRIVCIRFTEYGLRVRLPNSPDRTRKVRCFWLRIKAPAVKKLTEL
jgi:hypothetical protein